MDDPVAWFNSLPRDVVETWRCHWMSEPWGMEWDRHVDMMHLLDVLVSLQANRGLHPDHPEWHSRYKPRAPVEFMPGDYVRSDSVQKPRGNVFQQLAQEERAFKNGNDHQ